MIASAILDRLVHHDHLVPIVGGVLPDKEHHGKTERRWFHSVGGQASRPLTGPLRRVTLHDHRGSLDMIGHSWRMKNLRLGIPVGPGLCPGFLPGRKEDT